LQARSTPKLVRVDTSSIKGENRRVASLDAELAALGGDLLDALEDLPMASALLDRAGAVKWQNAKSRELSGDIVGMAFAQLVRERDRPRFDEALKGMVERGEPVELEIEVRHRDGEFVSVEVSSVPVKAGATVVGIFGLGRSRQPEAHDAAGDEVESPLTGRQRDVLRLLAEGRSTDEIAVSLSLSPTTVRNYIARILAALGVNTRLQAVLVAKQRGLV
jgi:PAS domain S-box-containing protein